MGTNTDSRNLEITEERAQVLSSFGARFPAQPTVSFQRMHQALINLNLFVAHDLANQIL